MRMKNRRTRTDRATHYLVRMFQHLYLLFALSIVYAAPAHSEITGSSVEPIPVMTPETVPMNAGDVPPAAETHPAQDRNTTTYQPKPTPALQENEWRYVTRPSDTIWSIAKDYLNPMKTWVDLVRHNHIEDPNALPPGSTLAIPFAWLKVQPAPAIAVSVSGEALLKDSQSSQWNSLKNKQYLHVGDTIKTMKGSVLVKFADGSVLRLENHTTLIFNRLSQFGKSGMTDTGLRLEKGRVSTKVEPMKENGSRYEISTPSAVAAVRGTEFRVEVTEAGSNLEVTEGEVSFASSRGSVLVKEGFGAQVSATGALSPITPLPAKPKVKQLPSAINQFPIQLAWHPVAGAAHYHYSLYEGAPTDGQLIQQQRINTPEVLINHLNNGLYTVTIRAESEKGLQGVDDVQTIRVNLKAEPVTLLSPEDGAVIERNQPVFRWAPSQPDHRAKLQVAPTDQFYQPIIDSAWVYRNHQNLEVLLDPGRYYWRVIAQAGNESTSASEVRSFTLKQELPAPKILSVNHQDETSKVFWKRIAMAQSYTVQLARDAAFDFLEQEQTTEETSMSIRIDKNTLYYLRVRANGQKFYTSSFSDVTQIELTY